MTNLSALQEWFFRQLESDLRQKHPEITAAFDAAPPQSDAEASQWAERFEFPPLKRWTTLINATFSIEFGLEELTAVLNSLKEARDGRAVWSLTEAYFVTFGSCLDRLEFLVKTMERSKPPLISHALGMAITTLLGEAAAKLAPLRNSAAHGPQQQMAKNWLGAPGRESMWEVEALSGGDGSGIADALFSSQFKFRDQRHRQLAQMGKALSEKVESAAAQLKEKATDSTK